MNQRDGVRELAKNYPHYAEALSGRNPPGYPSQESDPRPKWWLLILLIVPQCFIYFIWEIFKFFRTPNSAGFNVNFGALLGLTFGVVALVFGLIFLAVGMQYIESYTKTKREEPPPKPIAMRPLFFNLDQGRMSIEATVQVPDQPISDSITNLLYQEVLRALEQKPGDSDTLEYLVAPGFGRIIYEAQIPVFRYEIRMKVKPPAPPDPPTHNVYIGEIISLEEEVYDGGKVLDPWR